MNIPRNALALLKEPFRAEYISFRAGAVTRDKKKAQALVYADSRAYEERLDEVFGIDWSVTFKPWGETRLICHLTIGDTTRSSTGEFDQSKRNAIAEGTVAEAQAFKRACSKFGLGRYLYDIPTGWVAYDAEKQRFIETPIIPKRYLPSDKSPPTRTEKLSPKRVSDFVKELRKHGYAPEFHVAIANKALGVTDITTLSELSEGEALEVWAWARKNANPD